MDILFQLLLAIGSPIFEGLMRMVGGANIVFGQPNIYNRAIVSNNYAVGNNDFHVITEPGTISHKYLDVLRRTEQIKEDEFTSGHFLYIPVMNKQKSRIENSKAMRVYAKLLFFDLNGKGIGNSNGFDGRWGNSVQPFGSNPQESIRFIDISAGDQCFLDVAFQTVKGDSWYVWNNDSYKVVEYPENQLLQDGFTFHIKLNGDNILERTIAYTFYWNKETNRPEFVKK